MGYLHDDVLDSGLSLITSDATHLYICSAQPTTYAEATSTYALGNKATITVGSPADRAGGGRKVAISAITDGSVTGTGTAAYYAIVDSVNSKLLATQSMVATQNVTSGNQFVTDAVDIGIPDAV
ncbi:MAG: hypothetical protein ACWGQW_02775 [bacterium]